MARAIDQKIVQMKMDNSDFTSKVKATLEAFRGLTSGMNKIDGAKISGPATGLATIANSAKGTNVALDSLAANVESLAGKFTVMGQVGQAAIANITNRIVDTGGRVAKAISVEPLIDGYKEYAESLQSVNVIMNNVPGAKLKDVQGTLATLNTYADKTIYSFGDMTSSMGTFTAAGVGLKDSATAIQGIGNLAATSGSNTQQMSMAMYQLSQALASGKVGLQDWNSVVNAGMGGQKFQKALSATAKELGHGRDESVSFRDSLQDGWLTSEVLLKTLAKFKDDKSMQDAATKVRTFGQALDTTKEALGSAWSSFWQNVIGDSEEAPVVWTKLANAIQVPIGAMENYLKTTSKAFHDTGGRTALINGLTNVFVNLGKILGTVAKAFADVFPPATGQQITNIAKAFEQWTEKIKISDTDLSNLRKTFDGLFTILKWGVNLIKGFGAIIAALIPDNLFSVILKITAALGDVITSVDKGTFKMGSFGKAIGGASKFVTSFGTVLGASKSVLDFFAKALSGLMPIADQVASYLGKAFKKMGDALANSLSSGKIDPSKILAAGFGTAFLVYLRNLQKGIDSIAKTFSGGGPLKKVVSAAEETLGGLGKALSAFTGSVRIATLASIALAMLGLALAIKTLASVPNKDVFKSLEMLAVMMLMMNKSLTALGDMKGSVVRAVGAAAAMVILGLAINEMAIALKILATIKPEDVAKSLLLLSTTVLVMVSALVVMSNQSIKSLAGAAALLILAGALDLISVALAGLSMISMQGLAKGVSSIGAILTALAAFVLVVNRAKFGMGTAVSIAVLSASIVVMSGAVAVLSSIPFDNVVQGLTAMAALLLEIGAFALIANGVKMGTVAIQMLILSGALAVISGVLLVLGKTPWQQLVTGFVALAGVIILMAGAMIIMQGSVGGAAAMAIMAAAMNLLVVPLLAFSKMSLPGLAIGLTAMAASLAILIAAGFGAELVSLGLITLAASMVLIGASAALTGAGLALAGAGIALFSTGLLALIGVGVAGVNSLISVLTALLNGVITLAPKMAVAFTAVVAAIIAAIVNNIPAVVAGFLQLIQGILNAILQNGPQIVNSMLQIVIQLGNTIAANIGPMIDMMANLVIQMATALGNNAGPLIDAGIQLMLKLINGMADGIRSNSAQIVDSVLNMVESILEVIVDALGKVMTIMFGWIPGFKGVVSGIGTTAKEALRDTFGIDEVAKGKTDGAVSGVNSRSGAMNSAGTNLAGAAKNGFNTLPAQSLGSGKGQEFVNGLAGKTGGANGAGQQLANGGKGGAQGVGFGGTGSNKGQEFVNGLAGQGNNAGGAGRGIAQTAANNAVADFHSKGADGGEGYAQGVYSKLSAAGAAGSALAQAALAAAQRTQDSHSPSKKFAKLGDYAGLGYALGMDRQNGLVADSSAGMANTAIQAIASASSDINDALNDNLELQPTITPVLDLSQMDTSRLNMNSSSIVPLGNSAQLNQQNQTVKLDSSEFDNKLDAILVSLKEISEQNAQPVTAVMSTAQATGALNKYSNTQDRTSSLFKG